MTTGLPNTNLTEIASILTTCLTLQRSPIAISFSDFHSPEIPLHSGRVPAGCRFWEDAGAGAFATTAADHRGCAIGVYTHNLQPSPEQQKDLMDALTVFGELGYVRKEDLPQIPVLGSRPKYVIYSPLSQAQLSPDVVILFVHANQMLILSEATQQVENQVPLAMGRPACAVVPQVVNTGRAALSLGCCGARAYLNVFSDDVALFAIPGVKLAAYAERIAVVANANEVLSQFHHVRRQQIEAGMTPTVKDSLAALNA